MVSTPKGPNVTTNRLIICPPILTMYTLVHELVQALLTADPGENLGEQVTQVCHRAFLRNSNCPCRHRLTIPVVGDAVVLLLECGFRGRTVSDNRLIVTVHVSRSFDRYAKHA